MVAKALHGQNLKKRKQVIRAEGDVLNLSTKKLRPGSIKSRSIPKKGSEGIFALHTKRDVNSPSKKSKALREVQPETKRECRLRAKELADVRKKKRKRHYLLEQELALLWEKMRCRDVAKEDKSKLVSEALQKMKGKIPEIACSHVASRILQTCIKHCSQAERDAVFGELQPHILTFTCNTYAVHLVKKMLDNASKKQLSKIISSLRGHVASLLRHMVGSVVIEHAYLLGDATQKLELVMELYSAEFQLFKDIVPSKESRLSALIPKLGLQKGSVLRHMTYVVQPILEKGIVDHSVVHKLLMEYLSIADQSSATDIIQHLSGPLLVRMIHTRDGCRLGIFCVKYGTPKERKKIIKGMKDHVTKIALDQCGSLTLVCILSVVDDTKLITKIVIRELKKNLKELVSDKNGRRLFLHLLHPNSSRYFSPDDLASLSLSIPSLSIKADQKASTAESSASSNLDGSHDLVEGGKKDPFLRRQELLVNSGLAKSVIDTCIESAGEFLKSKFGKDMIYEVATGGAGGILCPVLGDRINALHEAVASLAAIPKSVEEAEEHVLENFHSSRMIRKLVLDCPPFASSLWKGALQGKCGVWAKGHSQKIVCAYLESSDPNTCSLAKGELQPLLDDGTLELPHATRRVQI